MATEPTTRRPRTNRTTGAQASTATSPAKAATPASVARRAARSAGAGAAAANAVLSPQNALENYVRNRGTETALSSDNLAGLSNVIEQAYGIQVRWSPRPTQNQLPLDSSFGPPANMQRPAVGDKFTVHLVRPNSTAPFESVSLFFSHGMSISDVVDILGRRLPAQPVSVSPPAAQTVTLTLPSGSRRLAPQLPVLLQGSSANATATYQVGRPPPPSAESDLGWTLANAHTQVNGKHIVEDLGPLEAALRPLMFQIMDANGFTGARSGEIRIMQPRAHRDEWSSLLRERERAGLPLHNDGEYIAVRVGENGWESLIHPNDLNGGASGGFNVADAITGAGQHRPTARVPTSLQSYLAANGNKTALSRNNLDDLSKAIEGDRGIELHWSSYPTALTRGGGTSYDTSFRRPAKDPAMHSVFSVFVVEPGSTSLIGGAIQVHFDSDTTLNDVARVLTRGVNERI